MLVHKDSYQYYLSRLDVSMMFQDPSQVIVAGYFTTAPINTLESGSITKVGIPAYFRLHSAMDPILQLPPTLNEF